MARTKRKEEPEIAKEIIETESGTPHNLSRHFLQHDVRGWINNTRSNVARRHSERRKSDGKLARAGTSLKAFGKKVLTFVDFSFIMKIVNKLKQRSLKTMPNNKSKNEDATDSKTSKQRKSSQKWYQNSIMRGIIGIVVALVTVSVAYSVGRVYLGDEDPISRLMIAPAASAVVVVLGVAFWKVLK